MQTKAHDTLYAPWRSGWRPRPQRPNAYRANIYRAILAYCAEHGGNTPTIRETQFLAGISSTSVVNYHIQALIDDGHLEWKDRKLIVCGGVWIPPPGGSDL